jgi:hypothetical protein
MWFSAGTPDSSTSKTDHHVSLRMSNLLYIQHTVHPAFCSFWKILISKLKVCNGKGNIFWNVEINGNVSLFK